MGASEERRERTKTPYQCGEGMPRAFIKPFRGGFKGRRRKPWSGEGSVQHAGEEGEVHKGRGKGEGPRSPVPFRGIKPKKATLIKRGKRDHSLGSSRINEKRK